MSAKDPMEMTKEEYDASISELINVEQTEEPEAEEPEAEEPEAEEPEAEEPEAEEPEAEEPEVEEPETDEQLFEIMYKGKKHKLTREKMTELAQKGFSYHTDMNRIAPHKKLVTLIESDEEISKIVNNYVAERAKPKVSKMEDFDTEEEWLEDNLTRRQKAAKFAQVKSSTPGQEIIDFFRTKDPENYEKVLTAVGSEASQLTVAEYEEINKSMVKLEEFYDKVKAKISAPVKPKPTFRARSGGGVLPRKTKGGKNAWELSSKDFNKLIQEVKGY
jgi:chemotaxis protein histidine kinase CheA